MPSSKCPEIAVYCETLKGNIWAQTINFLPWAQTNKEDENKQQALLSYQSGMKIAETIDQFSISYLELILRYTDFLPFLDTENEEVYHNMSIKLAKETINQLAKIKTHPDLFSQEQKNLYQNLLDRYRNDEDNSQEKSEKNSRSSYEKVFSTIDNKNQGYIGPEGFFYLYIHIKYINNKNKDYTDIIFEGIDVGNSGKITKEQFIEFGLDLETQEKHFFQNAIFQGLDKTRSGFINREQANLFHQIYYQIASSSLEKNLQKTEQITFSFDQICGLINQEDGGSEEDGDDNDGNEDAE